MSARTNLPHHSANTRWGLLASLLVLPGIVSVAGAQERSQADVSVDVLRVRPSGTETNVYDVEVQLFSENDDDAQDGLVYVFLPPESRAANLPTNCSAPSAGPGYVLCTLGRLPPALPSSTITFTASVPPTFILPRFGSFGLSATADHDLSNNLHQLIADRTLVRERSQAEVYVIVGHAKFQVPDPETLHRLYGGWDNVHVEVDGTLQSYTNLPDEGTHLREETDARVWRIEAGKKRWVTSPDHLPAGRWAWVGVVPDGSLSSLQEGDPIQ